MNIEKKLINLFRTFVEKALAPQIKKFDGSLVEWNRFVSLISADSINYSQLQLYVDTLPGTGVANGVMLEKPNPYKKKQQGDTNDFGGFNPSKTFGGERNKLNIFQVPEDSAREFQREDSGRQKTTQNSNSVLANLDKLLKSLDENQSIIENLGKDEQTIRKSGGNGNNSINKNTGNNTSAPKRETLPYGGGFMHNYSNSGNYSPQLPPNHNSAPYYGGGNGNSNYKQY